MNFHPPASPPSTTVLWCGSPNSRVKIVLNDTEFLMPDECLAAMIEGSVPVIVENRNYDEYGFRFKEFMRHPTGRVEGFVVVIRDGATYITQVSSDIEKITA